jgi:hypothetical protein
MSVRLGAVATFAIALAGLFYYRATPDGLHRPLMTALARPPRACVTARSSRSPCTRPRRSGSRCTRGAQDSGLTSALKRLGT